MYVRKKYDSTDNTLYFGYYEYATSDWTYSNYELFVYEIDLQNDTITNVSSQYTRTGRDTTSYTSSYGYNKAFCYYTGIDFTNSEIIYGRNNNTSSVNIISYYYTNSTSSINTFSNGYIAMSYGIDTVYVPAETQFTLDNDNQLLPGKIALGADGSHTGDGSIYQNLDIASIIQSTLNRPVERTGDYISSANGQAVKYYEYDTEGTDSSLESNIVDFYEQVYNTDYTPLLANYYGFEYLSLAGDTYFYLNTDRNLVIVDLTTNTSVIKTLCTLSDTNNSSVVLLKPKELLLYTKSNGHVCIYDINNKTEYDTNITANTSAYKGFYGIYTDDTYIFFHFNGTYGQADVTLYVLNSTTFANVTSKSGLYSVTNMWKSLNDGYYYFNINTSSQNQLWKFDGSTFTRLRAGGYTSGLQAGRLALTDNTYIYTPYREEQRFIKWSKTGSDSTTNVNVTNNTSVTTLRFDTMIIDGQYIWTVGHTGNDYYLVKCSYSLVSQVPTFTEIEKVKISNQLYMFADNTKYSISAISDAYALSLAPYGFDYVGCRQSTYNSNYSNFVMSCFKLKRVTETTYENADIDGVCEQSTSGGYMYPVYHIMNKEE